VIVPARNEARNIERCVTSILATSYPNLELIVIDDASTDKTREIAERAIAGDPRARVITNSPLPSGWFGKHWACSTGASLAQGQILQFTDADTAHAPDLVTRSINAMQRTRADLFSVAGHQELGGFWEKIIQPQMFAVLSMRYGGSESITQSSRVSNKIANGQCIFVDRNSYDAIGGHASVRSAVAEDLLLAQRFFAARKHVVVMVGVKQLSTRMYASLREIITGWRKNVFAGGLDAVPFGKIGQSLLPLALLLPPLLELLPPLALLFALFGAPAGSAIIVWAAISCAATLIWWLVVYATMRANLLYAFAYPLGALTLLYIFFTAVIRGRRVTWKGRTYISQ
ncbi:MAG TPA: glycosyltransferase, partial [Gemmatimonadaceae bacterium]|nr:glycosyltransferase [Gemmatimonadaceae bacterium]